MTDSASLKINRAVPPEQLGVQVAPHVFKRVLEMPIDVVFPITLHGNIVMKIPPAVSMLYQMLKVASEVIRIIRIAAESY
jgi:hypothetical protein